MHSGYSLSVQMVAVAPESRVCDGFGCGGAVDIVSGAVDIVSGVEDIVSGVVGSGEGGREDSCS